MPPEGVRIRRDRGDYRGSALHRQLAADVDGEVRFDAGTRALYATAASNYRQEPIGVVVPRTTAAAAAALAICHHHQVPVLPRGGGTSLAGQCCNHAVVIDCSRHLTGVEIDGEAALARVQPGLILDRLKAAAAPHGLDFGPDPATHDRCTLGGMIGNDSCGVHSLMAELYGPGPRTSHHVQSLDVLTYDGVRMQVGRMSPQELRLAQRRPDRAGRILRELEALRDRHGELIRGAFPKLPRRASGYDLPSLLEENGFDVGRALVGTEATCVFVLGATLRLTPRLPHRVLVAFGFPDAESAADAVPAVRERRPVACEGIDHVLADNMRRLGRHQEDLRLLPDGKAWLLIEHAARGGRLARLGRCGGAPRAAGRLPARLQALARAAPPLRGALRPLRPGLRAHAHRLRSAHRRRGRALPALHRGRGGAGARPRRLALRRARRRSGSRRPARGDVRRRGGRAVPRVQGDLGPGRGDEPGQGGLAATAHRGPAPAHARARPWPHPPRPRSRPPRLRSRHRALRRRRQVPQDRRRHHVPELHGHQRRAPHHARTRPHAVRDDARRSPRRERLAQRRGDGVARPVPGVQGVQARVPGERGHGRVQGGVPVAPLPLAPAAAPRLRLRPDPRLAGAGGAGAAARRSPAPLAAGGGAGQVAGRDRARARAAGAGAGDLPADLRRALARQEPGRPPGAAVAGHLQRRIPPGDPRRRGGGAGRRRLPGGIPRRRLCCGRPTVENGWLKRAQRTLRRSVSELAEVVNAGVPIVGVEPSCTVALRDELRALLPDDEQAARTVAATHSLGMAGALGFRSDTYVYSKALAERRLLPALRERDPATLVIADGFSCREQLRQLGGVRPLHLAEALLTSPPAR